jgi:hypothetical protein
MLFPALIRCPGQVSHTGVPMFRTMRRAACSLFAVLLGSVALLGQQTTAASSSTSGLEFPVILRQTVTAGKTPVGSKIQAQLILATMAEGVVIPKGAIFSGEVTESVKKSATDASRLALRMDSVEWKSGSAPLKVYLTAWFYPEAQMVNQNLSYQPLDASNSKKNWNGMGPYPDPNNPLAQEKFPGPDADKDKGLQPATPASNISKHRVLMKNLESTRTDNGAVILTSTHTNIKLDKLTTYVLAAGDLLPMK